MSDIPEDYFQVCCDECGATYWSNEEDVSPSEKAKRQCQACWYEEVVYGDTRQLEENY
jgi:hypothetical protein